MFNENADAKEYIVSHRLSKVVSAYLTEGYFEEKYLKEFSHTNGWYIDTENKKLDFFVVKNKLNDLDLEIAKLPQISVTQVYFDNDDVVLKEFKTGQTYTIDEYVKKNKLKTNSVKAPNISDDDKAKNRDYCDYLIEKHQLMEEANKAYISDCFLGKYFHIMDIDFFVKTKVGFLAIDVKYRYPASEGFYGINSGPFEVYKKLNANGFEVFNIVMRNPTGKMDCIDYMKQDKQIIKYAYVDSEKEYEKRISPKKCSYNGDRPQSYYIFYEKYYSDFTGIDFMVLPPKTEKKT